MHERFSHSKDLMANEYHMCDRRTLGEWKRTGEPEDVPFLIPWGKLPRELDPRQITVLRLQHDDNSVVEIPELVRRMSNLIALMVPRRMVGSLVPEAIPMGLKYLIIRGEGKAKIDSSLRLPKLEHLLSEAYGELDFDPAHFPELCDVELRLDPKGKALRILGEVKRLESLNVAPCSNQDVLSSLVALAPKYLRINRGHLDSLEPLRNAQTITDLWIQDFPKLSSLEPLTGMKNLEELSVAYCTRLRLNGSLLKIKNLKKLAFWGCKDIGLDALRPQLQHLLEPYLTSGTR